MLVLVTRASEDASRTARKLEARGHEALCAPVIEIATTGEPAPAGPYDAIVVTSAHAAEALSAIENRQLTVFAVGERTAETVRDAGFSSVSVAEGDAASLSRLIRREKEPGLTLLHVMARHHKDEPAASLRASGFHVLQWEAYEARATGSLPPTAIEALRSGKIGAALHYSRRSADLLVRRMGEAGLTSTLGSFPHLCLSADVAVPLEAMGAPVLVAEEPAEGALLGLLDGPL
ncbi:uroporphyrinogen-III synthase [Microvirga roseola]|uniref:uroporphyrinogen-III synthase n=1 Tax=Microvirga roseola TaxID=2883126 RepID=UPI001E46F147|nr:uroporphyrinogen-III synthase [Microvirga roseola]